tara:strand:+ start:208 stop:420 length:213 start_codon:yes stop_codon:yes gene_type:complete
VRLLVIDASGRVRVRWFVGSPGKKSASPTATIDTKDVKLNDQKDCTDSFFSGTITYKLLHRAITTTQGKL